MVEEFLNLFSTLQLGRNPCDFVFYTTLAFLVFLVSSAHLQPYNRRRHASCESVGGPKTRGESLHTLPDRQEKVRWSLSLRAMHQARAA